MNAEITRPKTVTAAKIIERRECGYQAEIAKATWVSINDALNISNDSNGSNDSNDSNGSNG